MSEIILVPMVIVSITFVWPTTQNPEKSQLAPILRRKKL